MTATAPAPQPTDEQLKAYAEQLPDLYKDILAACQFADPNRMGGEEILLGTLRNYLRNRAHQSRVLYRGVLPLTPIKPAMTFRPEYPFSTAVLEFTESAFEGALRRLTEVGLLERRGDYDVGSLIPTVVGERLITVITGQVTPQTETPDLPNPTW